jgi:hypothetical protein
MSRASQPTLPDKGEAHEPPPSTQRQPAPPRHVYLHFPVNGVYPAQSPVAKFAAVSAVCDQIEPSEAPGTADVDVNIAWHEAEGETRTDREGFFLVTFLEHSTRAPLGSWKVRPPVDLRNPKWHVEAVGQGS